jgi:hypothetical protein
VPQAVTACYGLLRGPRPVRPVGRICLSVACVPCTYGDQRGREVYNRTAEASSHSGPQDQIRNSRRYTMELREVLDLPPLRRISPVSKCSTITPVIFHRHARQSCPNTTLSNSGHRTDTSLSDRPLSDGRVS